MGKNGERKSQLQNRNPGGQEEDFGLHSHSKYQQNTPRKFRSCDFSHETLEDLTLGGREENESERAVRRQGGCQPLFNRLFYISLNVPGYIRAKSISPRA
jgi:hypothetical protein